MQIDPLIKAAQAALANAYAPYSGFAVGAALQTPSATFVGCNIENVSLGLTICAERTAVAAAVAAGDRTLLALAIVADSTEPPMPCGACRQVLAEFNPDLRIVSSTVTGRRQEFNLAELLPAPRQGILEGHV